MSKKHIWWLNSGGGGLVAKGTLSRVWLSDSHDERNASLGGTANPLQTAYLALPSGDRAVVDYVVFGGDAWSSEATPNETQIKDELTAAGITDKVFGVAGNHDERGYKHFCFDDIFDPLGASPGTSGRTAANFPITPVGNNALYSLKKGNFLNILVGDDQTFGNRQGESSGLGTKSFNAAGGYSNTTWRNAIYKFLSNLDCNIVWSTHHPFKNTTFGSKFLDSLTAGFAYLDPTSTLMYIDFETMRGSYMAFIENALAERTFDDWWKSVYGHAICVETGHIHADIDEVIDGLTNYETYHGVPHIYKACVTDKNFNTSFRSRVTPLVTFETINGSTYTVKYYVWKLLSGGRAVGYQGDLQKSISLKYPYNEDYVASNPSAPSAPTISSIDVTTKGCATVNVSKGSAHGVLVVRKSGGYATFTPSADTAYLRGDAAGDGTVVWMGTNTAFQDYGLKAGTYYYTVYSFNGQNDKITFSTTAAQQTATVAKADLTKILADLALDNGECVQFLDSRLGVTDSSGVQTWADQGPNSLDSGQATLANRPAYANERIHFAASNSKFLSTAYNSKHYFGHATATWLFDVPFGIFAKLRVGDMTSFRITSKSDATNIEFLFAINASDKLFFGIYDSSLSNGSITIESTAALTSYENKDIFVVVNYLGGRDFEYGGVKLFVYDKDGTLITSESVASKATSGTYRKIRNNSLPLEAGKQSFGTSYSKGQINGRVIKRGKIFEQHEINYLMDYFSYADDTSTVTYQSVLDRAIALQVTQPGTTFKNAQSQFYSDLSSVWSKIKYLVVLANDGSKEFAIIEWKNPAGRSPSLVLSPTFVSGSGIDFDGSTNYINTGAKLVTDCGMGLNNSHLGIYCYEDLGAGGISVGVGVSTTNAAIFINPRNGSNNFTSSCNDGTTDSHANSNSIGHFCISRTASGSYKKYINGSPVKTVSVTSTAITDREPFIGAFNANGSPSTYIARGVSLVHFGTGLNDSEVAAIVSAFDTFRAAVGL